MNLKNTFFGLGSILILIIILSIIGVLQPSINNYGNKSKNIVIEKDITPVYYGGVFRKNNMYIPNTYKRRIYY